MLFMLLFIVVHTPFRGKMGYATRSEAGHMDNDVKFFLKQHFRGGVVRYYSIPDFVRYVWEFDMSSLDLEEDQHFTLPPELCNEYLCSGWKDPHYDLLMVGQKPDQKPRRTEETAAIVFKKIWHNLASQLPAPTDHTPLSFLNLKESTVKGMYARYKPDFCTTSVPALPKQSWDLMSSCGEMKKHFWTEVMLKGYSYNEVIDVGKLLPVSGDV